MNAYTSVWKLRFLNGLQYRAAAAAGIATQLFFGLIFIMVFIAFYHFSNAEQPISLSQVVTYIWLQQMFLAFIALWFRDNELFSLITTGNIAYELCRPCRLYGFWFAKLLATRVSNAVLRCFPLLFIIFFLPEPYRMTLPPSAASFFLFVAALLIALVLVVAYSMLIYISVFWTMSPVGSILMLSVAAEFLAGMIIPVPLMPEWVQRIVYALPFHYMNDFPFRVYSGHIAPVEAAYGILGQLLWIAIIATAGVWIMNRALRRVVVQGG